MHTEFSAAQLNVHSLHLPAQLNKVVLSVHFTKDFPLKAFDFTKQIDLPRLHKQIDLPSYTYPRETAESLISQNRLTFPHLHTPKRLQLLLKRFLQYLGRDPPEQTHFRATLKNECRLSHSVTTAQRIGPRSTVDCS